MARLGVVMDGSEAQGEKGSPERLLDLLAEDLDILFCGINPALSAARSGHHFSNRNNRFWRALHLAEFTPHRIQPEDDHTILLYGCGLTTAVERPTVKASELALHEYRAAAETLEEKVRRCRPRFLAFLGKPAFAALFNTRSVRWGRQELTLGGAEVWVLPNPSGLNRAFTLDALVSAYRELRKASQEAGSIPRSTWRRRSNCVES
ncbi:G:T/U mismatch-specific uracil/thymine DNA-glycosylase [Granulicella sibirica]|uniref:G:T/U mismatch-specific uracil/thymine DNA-glycosylase n=2 Tax=Granulicella sibirica TaxID=2479048 RepID=A0A4Q0SX49_9BACT|nr:G:T/U mismatch-specific uracil/thymine DNA-glycosylase [Granulicella sibirica]